MSAELTVDINQFLGIKPSDNSITDDLFHFEQMENFYIENSTGELKVREGTYNQGNSANAALGHKFMDIWTNDLTGDSWIVLITSGDKVEMQVNIQGNIFNTNIAAAALAGLVWGFQYNNLYYLLGSGGLYTVTTAAVTTSVNATYNLTYGCIFKERMFAIDGTTTNVIRYSDVGLPATIQTTNFITVGKGDGERITGMQPISGDRLLIFKETSIWVLYIVGNTTATWELKLVSADFGSAYYTSVQYYDGMTYFIGMRGVYRTDGVSVQTISGPVEHWFTSRGDIATGRAPATGGPIPEYTKNDYAGIWNNQYIFTMQEVTNTLFIYNIEFNAWYTWTHSIGQRVGFFVGDTVRTGALASATFPHFSGLKFTTLAGSTCYILIYNNQKDAPFLLTASSWDIPVYYADAITGVASGGSSNGGGFAYTATLVTNSISFNEYIAWKRFRQAYVTIRGAASFVLSSSRSEDTYTAGGTVAITGSTLETDITVLKFKLFRFEQFLKIKLIITPEAKTSAYIVKPISVYAIKLLANVKGRIAKTSRAA